MRKRTDEPRKRCPKCGKIENQIKAGYNGSWSQRCKCKEHGIYYTIESKRHWSPEETEEQWGYFILSYRRTLEVVLVVLTALLAMAKAISEMDDPPEAA